MLDPVVLDMAARCKTNALDITTATGVAFPISDLQLTRNKIDIR